VGISKFKYATHPSTFMTINEAVATAESDPPAARTRNAFFAYAAGTKEELEAVVRRSKGSRIKLALVDAGEIIGTIAYCEAIPHYINKFTPDSPSQGAQVAILSTALIGTLALAADLTSRYLPYFRDLFSEHRSWPYEQPGLIGRIRSHYAFRRQQTAGSPQTI
jgi:hypothetical protein